MSNTRHYSLRVVERVQETHDSCSLRFEVPPDLRERFAYRPGQFLTLRLPVRGRHLPRCYSMSSAPTLDEGLRITVKRVAQGRGSNWICDNLQVGDSLEVMPPAGVFTPDSLQGDFLLWAGGSGVTPVLSILRSVLAHGQGRIRLVYANRDERSVIFRDVLRELALAHPARLQVIHWLDSVQGVPSVAQLRELARSFEHATAFVCGPGPFMDAVVSALEHAGVDESHVHVERFVSLPDEEDREAIRAAADEPAAAVESALVAMELDGEIHEFSCAGDETILDAALRAGLAPPHSCQAGMCASCMCQVTEGEVRLRHNEVLDDKDLAKAWTLSCQAVPLSPTLRVRFPG